MNVGVNDILAGLSDTEQAELFGGIDAVKQMRQAQALQGERRRQLAIDMASIAATPSGARLLDYLAANYVLRHENVTALGLPLETAIQLHARKDGQRELVDDLLRLVNEGREGN